MVTTITRPVRKVMIVEDGRHPVKGEIEKDSTVPCTSAELSNVVGAKPRK